MNYYRLDLKSFMSSVFVWTIFLSDFGLVIAGQPIYFFQILAFGYLISYLIYKPYIEVGWLLFFALAIVSIWASNTLLFEPRQFAGDTYPWTSIKAFINILLFYAAYKTTLFAYHKINPNLFLYLSIFMILYGSVEMLFGSNPAVKEILQLLHTNPKALDKNSISLLGREHSYGALGYMIAACILIYFYLTKTFVGYKSYLALVCAFLLVLFVILARSKSVYIGLFFFGILVLILMIKQRNLTFSSILIFCSASFAIGLMSLIVIQNSYFVDATEAVTGGVGSGSTFIRFNFLYVAVMQGIDNPFFGVGPGNYKLFFVEYVDKLGIPIILELEAITDPSYMLGGIDPTNFFAGIFSEFGIITFTAVFYVILKRISKLLFNKNTSLNTVSLALMLSPVLLGAAFGFYYWAVSYFPFFLALLHLDYKRLGKVQ